MPSPQARFRCFNLLLAHRYVISDQLNAGALKLGPSFNDINAASASAFDTLLTGRCGMAAPVVAPGAGC